MTERRQALFNKVTTVVLSTSSPDGQPNAVPVGAKKIIDAESILISDQYLSKTLTNLKSNPRASVTFWDGFEGYQPKCAVAIETSGARFEETARWIEEMSARMVSPLKSKGAVILKIERIYGVSPGPGAGKQLA